MAKEELPGFIIKSFGPLSDKAHLWVSVADAFCPIRISIKQLFLRSGFQLECSSAQTYLTISGYDKEESRLILGSSSNCCKVSGGGMLSCCIDPRPLVGKGIPFWKTAVAPIARAQLSTPRQ